MSTFRGNAREDHVNNTEHIDDELINIGSRNGLVSSGNKPTPVTMLTQIYVAIWHH